MLVKKQSAAIAVTAIRARRGTPEAERRAKKREEAEKETGAENGKEETNEE